MLFTDNNGNELDAYTDVRGEFSFTDVLPGQYGVSVDGSSLPDRFVFTTDETVTIDVSAETPPAVQIGGFIKPKEVIITFQPPTADFYFAPDQPKAGETVTFDGSDSFDFDGKVVAYAWDFDADGETDANDVIAEVSFPAAGSYDVTLTITDNGGNSDSITYAVDVK
jgi:PKD repeat protein